MSAPGAPPTPWGGMRLRTDLIELYVLRFTSRGASLLQLLRVGEPMSGSWQPVMGKIEPGETALGAASREALEEIGLGLLDALTTIEVLALQGVHPYFVCATNEIHLPARFVAFVEPTFKPVLNKEHEARRWVSIGNTGAIFWPGQRAAIEEALSLRKLEHRNARHAQQVFYRGTD